MFKVKQSFSLIQALVLKSKPVGESDKVLTLLSQEKGKFVCVAKGVRQMKSSKKACLESGNIARVYLIETKNGWPILTQANLTCDCAEVRNSLVRIKQLMQFLEVLDKVIVEEELEMEVFRKILLIRQMILMNVYGSEQIKNELFGLMEMLGFAPTAAQTPTHTSVLDYVATLTNQKMKSWAFLTVEQKPETV